MAFNLLNAAAPYLSDDFVAAEFDFYGKVMSGKLEQKPRWKRSLSTVNSALGEAVGQMGHLGLRMVHHQAEKLTQGVAGGAANRKTDHDTLPP